MTIYYSRFKNLILLLTIPLFLLLLLYIFQVNSLTKDIYFIKTHQQKLTELEQKNENLEISFSQAHLLSKIDDYLQTHSFEKVVAVRYIRILENQIVTK